MKLLRTLAVPFLVLGLVVSCGKKTPEGTTPPGETGSGGDASAGGSDAGGGDAGGGSASGGDATAGGAGGDAPAGDAPADASKVCDAEVSDTPRALFADNVLIRLPKGVDVVEQTPFFARITSSNTQSTCEAIVSFAAIGYFQTDTTKTVTQVRDETIKARGIDPSGITWGEETTKNRDYSASYEVGEGPKGEPPLKGWIALKDKAGSTFWVAFETHPNAWNAVKKSFQESAKRLIIVPQKK